MIPPQARTEKKLKVRFRRKPVTGIYQSGEVASFPVDEAHRLVVSGIAEPVDWQLCALKPEPEPAA